MSPQICDYPWQMPIVGMVLRGKWRPIRRAGNHTSTNTAMSLTVAENRASNATIFRLF